MKYTNEAKIIVDKYAKIAKDMKLLEEQTKLLLLRKQQIELELMKVREEERTLIDKIKSETGESPDFYALMQAMNSEPEGQKQV
jgi:hypothetical protein